MDVGVGEPLQGILLLVQRRVEAERPRPIHGMTMLSVTPASASSRCPSTPNLSMHTAWNSNGTSPRPYSARSALSLPMVSASCSHGHHRACPAVTHANGALECHLRVAADVERHRLAWRRTHLQLLEVVELAVEVDHSACEDELDHLDHLVHPLAALSVRLATPLEFLRCPTDSDAEAEPVIRQVRDGAHLARHQ